MRLLAFVAVVVAAVLLGSSLQAKMAAAVSNVGLPEQIFLPLVYGIGPTPTATAVPTLTPTITLTSSVTATPTVTPIATLTPIPPSATPTSTPIPACNGSYQGVLNPSFESGFSSWFTSGYPYVVSGIAVDGTHSVLMGGYDNASDLVFQSVPVPAWAETAALYASWDMVSTDTPYFLTDDLQINLFNSTVTTVLTNYFVWNTTAQGAWYYVRQPIPNITAYRGSSVIVSLSARTDSSFRTTWYVDKVWLVFACGATPASELDVALSPNDHLAAPVTVTNPAAEQALRDRLQNSSHFKDLQVGTTNR